MRFRSPRLPGGRWTVRSLAVGAALLAAGAAALVVPTTAGAEDVEAQAISHRVPFPCGQTWQGQTRTNHSPLRAIDFNRDGDFGDRVTASAAGTVVHRGKMDGTSYGRLVVVRHSNGTATYYAHLSEYRVQHGEQVSKGETLGLVGGSGFPNTPGGFGSHLHYEQRTSYGGSSVPIKFNVRDVYYYGTRSYTSRC
ncbi:M23 family metallopeptidase [Stackebrandtia nassauensis]|uniref:Peptidase M23 n=1 Tax=Stackebrandtia nassauensis (strain DSM 44728 / CIP 108903 / NRRL B-16338 / NBRC 102104 / LLR-40K-21) TaxID=446470 RepID=D3Q169_STANL|nr:M23 family metallopeptidase [Stackebrandtia nassauensis]ADD45649.1 Peptidase M23 [Stackebrandtia nassauensis DSM 44728]